MSKQKKELKRDARGRFIKSDVTNPNSRFYKRYIARVDISNEYIAKSEIEDLLYNAYTNGFANGKVLKDTVSPAASFRAWWENNK